MQRPLIGYFGYGSLVNRATLSSSVVAAFPARLKGWKRTWRPRPRMEGETVLPLSPSLLTAHRAPDRAIDGLLVVDGADRLGDLDAREFRYHRRDVCLSDFEFLAEVPQFDIRVHVYEARVELPPVAGPAPILRSYLDAVMQGFLREFGEAGLRRFVAETEAFHTPIHEDRHAPVYSRSVDLQSGEADLFDAVLPQPALKA